MAFDRELLIFHLNVSQNLILRSGDKVHLIEICRENMVMRLSKQHQKAMPIITRNASATTPVLAADLQGPCIIIRTILGSSSGHWLHGLIGKIMTNIYSKTFKHPLVA